MKRKQERVVSKSIRYIKENSLHSLTLTQIAEYVGVEKTLLCHQFKKVTGKTILEFIDSKRLEKAKKLLSYSHLYNYEIAEMVGFSNSWGDSYQKYFGTWFKKKTGLSPREYRRSLNVNTTAFRVLI